MLDDFCEVPRWQMLKSRMNNLNYEQFVELSSKDSNAIILDVRTPAEYGQFAIDNAINLDYLSYTLADELEGLDPNGSYYIYCRTGRRSLRVCVMLNNLGFTDIYNLEDGLVSQSVFSSDQK